MGEVLVIRFGSLGDLCLLGWSLSRLSTRDDLRVTLVTKPAFADLAARFRGVDRVVPLPGRGLGGVLRLASRLRAERWDRVLDAHAILRGDLLLALLGRRPDARLTKDTAARLRLLRGGGAAAVLDRTMRDRFDAVLAPLGEPRGEASPPLADLANGVEAVALGLAPGAMWPAKRWPAERFAALAAAFRARSAAPIRVFLGPREETWFAGSPLAGSLADLAGVEIWRGRPLAEVARGLAGCRRLVCNDSGLLHLAEAVGTPVVAFYGPTVRAFGYFPTLAESRALEVADLACRPCSRNGKRPCWRGDLACLDGIAAEAALAELTAAAAWPAAGSETP